MKLSREKMMFKNQNLRQEVLNKGSKFAQGDLTFSSVIATKVE